MTWLFCSFLSVNQNKGKNVKIGFDIFFSCSFSATKHLVGFLIAFGLLFNIFFNYPPNRFFPRTKKKAVLDWLVLFLKILVWRMAERKGLFDELFYIFLCFVLVSYSCYVSDGHLNSFLNHTFILLKMISVIWIEFTVNYGSFCLDYYYFYYEHHLIC